MAKKSFILLAVPYNNSRVRGGPKAELTGRERKWNKKILVIKITITTILYYYTSLMKLGNALT